MQNYPAFKETNLLDVNQRLIQDTQIFKEVIFGCLILGIFNRNKSHLLFLSAEMLKKPLWQTVWTQIRLLLYLGPRFMLLYLICQ